jgi:pimeloyl-ACP methyl ester carboxylesterase
MMFAQSYRILVAAAAIAAAASGSAFAQPPINSLASGAVNGSRPFLVRVEGNGRPMILIPGLMCDGTVWSQTVDRFKARCQCHVLSLAGFAGVPPVEGPFIPTMRDAIIQYIRSNRLEKPMLVGHSLGGHLALAIAIAAPQEVGPIVVVDGAPALGPLMSPGTSADTISRQTAAITSAMASMPQNAFAAQNHFTIARLVQNPKTAEWLAQIAGKSDVKTVARAMQEVMTADLRDGCVRIQSPVLLIGAAEYAKDEATQAAVRKRYEDQATKIPNHKVAMAYDSRHFIMLDKPDFFYGLLNQVLPAR